MDIIPVASFMRNRELQLNGGRLERGCLLPVPCPASSFSLLKFISGDAVLTHPVTAGFALLNLLWTQRLECVKIKPKLSGRLVTFLICIRLNELKLA